MCVLFKTACNFDIKQIFQDGEGRFIILDIILNSQKITLINVYGPNIDEPTFFENIQKELDDFECESIIWGGDFNCVQDITLDKKGGRAQTHVNSQKRIQDIMGAYDLVDIWRRKNPNVSDIHGIQVQILLFNVDLIIFWFHSTCTPKSMNVIYLLVSKLITHP